MRVSGIIAFCTVFGLSASSFVSASDAWRQGRATWNLASPYADILAHDLGFPGDWIGAPAIAKRAQVQLTATGYTRSAPAPSGEEPYRFAIRAEGLALDCSYLPGRDHDNIGQGVFWMPPSVDFSGGSCRLESNASSDPKTERWTWEYGSPGLCFGGDYDILSCRYGSIGVHPRHSGEILVNASR